VQGQKQKQNQIQAQMQNQVLHLYGSARKEE
jgi:hypothetical protein